MGVVVKISKKNSVEDTRKALNKLAKAKKRKTSKLADFYGKLQGAYGDGLEYQKKIRNEWP